MVPLDHRLNGPVEFVTGSSVRGLNDGARQRSGSGVDVGDDHGVHNDRVESTMGLFCFVYQAQLEIRSIALTASLYQTMQGVDSRLHMLWTKLA